MSEYILNCIEVGTQFLTAIATVFTVCFAYKQIEEAKREADEARNYDREQQVKAHQEAILENAYRVEAWIARDSNTKEPSAVKDETHERVLIVRNDSSGPIRNVQIEIEWPTEWTHEAQTSQSKVPDFSKGWSIHPQGTWIVRRKQNNEGHWDFPEPMGECDDQRYIPQFKLEDTGGWNSHRIVSIKFTDSHNNTWLREYNENSTCKLLLSAADKN